jgi:purine nucleoside permease
MLARFDAARGATLTGSATYNPPSLATSTMATTTVTVTGAALGDYVQAWSFTQDLAGILVSAYVSAADTVTVVLRNSTAGTLDIAEGTLRVVVEKV